MGPSPGPGPPPSGTAATPACAVTGTQSLMIWRRVHLFLAPVLQRVTLRLCAHLKLVLFVFAAAADSKVQNELELKENRIEELQRSNDELTRQLATQQKVVDQQKASIQKCIDVVKRLLIEKSTIEKKEARAKCMQNRLRLGQFVTQRVGATFQENWTDGYAFQVIELSFGLATLDAAM